MKQTLYQLCVVLILVFPAVAVQALTGLMEAARTHSLDAQILELQRERVQTDLSRLDFIPSPALSLSWTASTGTELLRDPKRFGLPPGLEGEELFTITGSPTLTLELQGDRKTEIQFGVRNAQYGFLTDPASDQSLWWATPFIGITQPLSHFFEENDALEDIEYSLIYLQAELSYRRGMIGIDQQVLSLLEQIITFDKQLADARFDLQRMKRDHERSLDIGTYSKDSARSRSAQQQIDSLERSIRSMERNREFSVAELELFAGVTIDRVPEIPKPEPVLEPSALGNTVVLLQALEEDKAREELKEFLRDPWELEIRAEYDAFVRKDQTSVPDQTLDVRLAGSYRDLILSAGVITDFAEKTVRGVVEGRWSIYDGRRTEEELNRRRLEQSLAIARQNREQEENRFLRRNSQFEIELASWERNMQQLELSKRYAYQDLQEAEDALERGIGRQREVDAAGNRIEQLEYNEQLLHIEGWKLMRSIEEHVL